MSEPVPAAPLASLVVAVTLALVPSFLMVVTSAVAATIPVGVLVVVELLQAYADTISASASRRGVEAVFTGFALRRRASAADLAQREDSADAGTFSPLPEVKSICLPGEEPIPKSPEPLPFRRAPPAPDRCGRRPAARRLRARGAASCGRGPAGRSPGWPAPRPPRRPPSATRRSSGPRTTRPPRVPPPTTSPPPPP